MYIKIGFRKNQAITPQPEAISSRIGLNQFLEYTYAEKPFEWPGKTS